MKKIVALCMGSVALLSAQTAYADTYSPDGTTYPSPWILQGTVDVNKGIALTCDLTLEVSVAPDGHSATATPSLSGGAFGLCSTITFNNTPYPVTFDGATSTLSISNVDVSTITPGGCSGTIGGTWNNVTKILSVNASLPGGGGSAPCTVIGDVHLISPSNGSVVDP
ncbi:hypothetical protein [Sphingomonas sp. DT-204]|uniref:hypothetical protein n=1 Tax=Sphingomonas sp. DT-204 TaxID=3396166 RepID=UPI003F1D5A09